MSVKFFGICSFIPKIIPNNNLDDGDGSVLENKEIKFCRNSPTSFKFDCKRLEELFYPGDSIPLYLDKKSETLKVIQQLRNEAHRFGITHHRDKRSKSALNSSIESIPGIGEKTMLVLIQYFKSVKRLKLATEKEISDVIGVSKAKKIADFYRTNNESK